MGWLKNLVVKIATKKAGKVLGLKEGPMEDRKHWYKSKTVLAGIFTVLFGTYDAVRATLAPQFGWELPEIPALVYTVLGALGVYGRATATAKVG